MPVVETPVEEVQRPKALMGVCLICNRGIPFGYLPIVTKWRTVYHGTRKVSQAEEMFCRQCAPHAEAVIHNNRKRQQNEAKTAPEVPAMSQKELAIAVYRQLSKVEGRTSSKLAKLAEMDDSLVPAIKDVLKKLHTAGKVKFEEGRWLRV